MSTAIERPSELRFGILLSIWMVLVFFNMSPQARAQVPRSEPTVAGAMVLRVATFNAAMNRKSAGELTEGLQKGDPQAAKIAEILRAVSPDVFLLNEIDYDERSAEVFLNRYLSSQEPTEQPPWKYFFAGPVNTGVDSGLDLDGNGKLHEPNDAWGFGTYPGQYGMAVFSRHEIQKEAIRTFQNFRWSQMPGALRPMRSNPGSTELESHYPDALWDQLRLSSKSHWDVPILIGGKTLHLIASHPTPPVFDGPEDRNGCRNHDEIRLLMDYVAGDSSGAYVVDDNGRTGPLATEASFVIAGDLNSDPIDGDGRAEAIRKLLEHPRLAKSPAPKSLGGVEASENSKGANLKHQADPATDTGDFNDRNPGNLRIDFVLPSANLKVLASGVYWPSKSQSAEANALVSASDHRLVWVDLQWESSQQ
jgi:endonuclease/exonuclease/phosphatase family metal-dependent hydrolase